MKQSKDLAIAALSITGMILLVGIIIVQTRPPQAFASGMTSGGGDYLMAVGQVQRSPQEDLLYVIDTREEKMLVYSLDPNRRQVLIADAVDLKKLREAGAPGKTARPPQRGGTPPPQRGRPRP